MRPLGLNEVVQLDIANRTYRVTTRAGRDGAHFKSWSYKLFPREEGKARNRNNWLNKKVVGLRAGLVVSRSIEVEKPHLRERSRRIDDSFFEGLVPGPSRGISCGRCAYTGPCRE